MAQVSDEFAMDPEVAARHVLAQIERSGYGTPRPDRYTPTFSLEVVRSLAEAVLAARAERET